MKKLLLAILATLSFSALFAQTTENGGTTSNNDNLLIIEESFFGIKFISEDLNPYNKDDAPDLTLRIDDDESEFRRHLNFVLGAEMELATREHYRLGNAPSPLSESFSFSGSLVKGNINLEWKIDTKENISHFVLEYRKDNISPFIEIAQIDQSGEITQHQSYDMIHEESYTDVNYYRLIVINTSGVEIGFKTIPIQAINPKEGNFLPVFPNPNKGETLFCKYETGQEATINIKISDSSGRTILSKEQEVTQGENTFGINVNTLSKGIYFIMINHNGETTNQRFIVI